jgi:hypothetical protein
MGCTAIAGEGGGRSGVAALRNEWTNQWCVDVQDCTRLWWSVDMEGRGVRWRRW